MPKVYLSPAYHYWNPCAVAGCDETTHNNLYLDVLEPYLAACGIQYKRGPRRTPKSGEDGDALMLQAVRESDAWGADVHYVSHPYVKHTTKKYNSEKQKTQTTNLSADSLGFLFLLFILRLCP